MSNTSRPSLITEPEKPLPSRGFHHALVTGASGCIGRSLVRHLAAEGCKVKALCRNTQDSERLFADAPPGVVQPLEGNLENPSALRKATEGVEIIFHAAAKVHLLPRNKQEEAEFFRVNLQGSENLLRAGNSRTLRAFIFLSTIAVYGPNAPNPLHESMTCHPEGAYAQSKFEAEQRILSIAEEMGVSATVLRLSLVFGEGERGNFQRMIRAIGRRRFIYVGNRECLKSMTYVDNVVEAARLAATDPHARGEIFNVADPSPYPMHAVVEKVAQELGISPPQLQLPASVMRIGGKTLDFCGRMLHFRPPFTGRDVEKLTSDTVCDISKIHRVLGFEPSVDLSEGIRRTVRWIRGESPRRQVTT